MRHLLTGLAILLIVVLTAALAGPYLIDWNGQRTLLEARLSQALGQKVTIGGSIDLKLLPTPYLILDQTVIGEDDGPIKTGIRHLDLELSVAPLLHGEFDIIEARLEEPTVRVTLQRDRTLPTLPDAPALRADVRFERIVMVDGTLAIADPSSGHTFVADHLDMTAEAPSLAGPFKGSGIAGNSATRTKFRFATSVSENGKTRARLVIDETRGHAGLDLDGAVALTDAGQTNVRQTFAGTASLTGHVWDANAAPLAWKLSGPFKADPQKARMEGGELRIGGEDSSLALQATAEGDFGAMPTLHLDLAAKQIDIDRLSGAPVDAQKPPPPKLPTLAQIRGTLVALTPPIPSSLDVAIDAAIYGGEQLSDLRAHLGAGETPTFQLSGEAPGGLHLALDGKLSAGGFDGAADVGADNLPRALAWLALVKPDSGLKPTDSPFKAVRLVGKVDADGRMIASNDLALTLDRSVLTGAVNLTLDSNPTKVTAKLTAQTLDLDALPRLGSLDGIASDFDLTLDAKAIKVARIGDGPLEAGRLDLAIGKTGGAVALKRFHADNLGGATVDATGRIDAGGATLAMTLDALHLEAAAALVKRLVPGDVGDALVARAGSLAPAKLKIDATLAAKAGGLTPTRLAIAGKLAATDVKADLTPAPDGSVTLAASLDAPEGSALLRQLGVPALPLDTIGRSRVSLTAAGRSDKPLDTKLQATFGASRLDVTGAYDLLATGRRRLAGAGAATLQSPDLGPLLQSLAIAFPDMTGRLPASGSASLAIGQAGLALSDIDGTLGGAKTKGALQWKASGQPALTGTLDLDRLDMSSLLGLALGPAQPAADGQRWSSLGFSAGLIDPPRAEVTLLAKTLGLSDGLVAQSAELDLGIASNQVTIKRLTAGFHGGHIGADLSLRRDGRQAALEGKVSADHVAITLPSVTTTLTGTLDVAGSGTSAATLVASLAGTGNAKITKLVISGADPKALPKLFDDVESDALSVDEDSVLRALDETAKGSLDAGDRDFGLSLAAGTLRFRETAPAPDQAAVATSIDATLDLRRTSLETHADETLRTLPKNWVGPAPSIFAIQSGPVTAPKRSYDVSSFINAVATRALARESARIEAYEFDIRERAFFNQRLQSERRREQDRLKAEEDARAAEADRKAKVEAARQEKVRREEAAKAAREKAEQDSLDRARTEQRAPATDPKTAPRFEAPAAGTAGDPSAAGRY